MIHLILRLPLPYQQTLCQALSEASGGELVAWFAERASPEFPYRSGSDFHFVHHFIAEVGYGKLFEVLKADPEAVVILGGWSSPMTKKTLAITTVLRRPVFIWADHPHPRERSRVVARSRRLYLHFLSRIVSGFLACGDPTVEHLVSLGIERSRVTCFPYWVELPKEWSIPARCVEEDGAQRPLRLVAIGRQVPIKQFEIAIAAVALANKNARREVVELVMIGDGPERTSLERRVRAIGCESVSFIGWRESDEVYAELNQCDALVVTSRFEPYSVIVLEAMACGRPVLAAEGIVAARDRDERTGAILFHPTGDVECLAAQITLLASDRDELRRASIAARATAEKWPPQKAFAILQVALGRTKLGSTRPGEEEVSPVIQSRKASA